MRALRFLFAIIGVAFGARLADASPPSSVNTLIPGGIQFGAIRNSLADASCELDITVRMSDNNPLANCPVEIHFADCAGFDLHLSDTQVFPGMKIVCANRVVATTSDAQGVAHFRIMGSASAVPGNSTGLTEACAKVYADGILMNRLNPVRVAAYDLDGANGMTPADEALFLSTLFAGPGGYRMRADYNGDGVCNSADLAKFLSVLFASGATGSVTSLCF